MKNVIRAKNILFTGLAFGLFFFGDIISTFLILKNGGIELNKLMSSIGFNGFVIFKIFLTILFGFMIHQLDKYKFQKESGIIIGMVLMSGLLATLINLGFFR